jgi:GNAT superfamily N-acetyltransferase
MGNVVEHVAAPSSFRQAVSPSDLEAVRSLFLEYARSLDFELCFQSFDEELAALPGDYALPDGRLWLAEIDGRALGCVGLHRRAGDICEMKRLYLRPEARGRGLGRALVEALVVEARRIGYRRMRLDTVGATMRNAVALYRSIGFKDIPAYRENPMPSVVYLELDLG